MSSQNYVEPGLFSIPFQYKDSDLLESYFAFNEYRLYQDKIVFSSSYKLNTTGFDNEIQEVLHQLKKGHLEILKLRLLGEMTLEEIGHQKEVTRERVRQIEEQAIRKLSLSLPKSFLQFVHNHLHEENILFLDSIPILNLEIKKLICQIISHRKFRGGVIFDNDLKALILDKKYAYRNIESSFLASIDSGLLEREEFLKLLEAKYPNIEAIQLLNTFLQHEICTELEDDKIFFHALYKSKREKIEFIYSLYEEGLRTTENIDELRKQLEKHFPGIFTEDSERAITGLVSISENILLWDWGKHIHIKFVQDILENYYFSDLLQYIDEQLETLLAVDLDGYYNTHSVECRRRPHVDSKSDHTWTLRSESIWTVRRNLCGHLDP